MGSEPWAHSVLFNQQGKLDWQHVFYFGVTVSFNYKWDLSVESRVWGSSGYQMKALAFSVTGIALHSTQPEYLERSQIGS